MGDWTPHLPPPKPPVAHQHCRHYGYKLGLRGGPMCAAGVDNTGGTGACMPEPRGTCPSRQDWTADERATWRAWYEQHMERIGVVFAAIPEAGAAGEVACPGCGVGRVSWSRASNNGHIHARCSTRDCFEVMQ